RAEKETHVLLCRREETLRERTAFPRKDHRAQLRFGDDHVAGEVDLAERVLLALVDADRDEDVALVGRYRDTAVLPAEIRVASVHVVRAQPLEVALERLPRVAVVVADEREQVAGRQLELIEQLLVGEHLVADDVDLTNLRALALLDLERHADAVVRQILDRGRDPRAVFAARVVLRGQHHRDLVEHGAIERLAAREADVAERLLERLVGNVLVAAERELRDRRTLENGDHERIAVAAQL